MQPYKVHLRFEHKLDFNQQIVNLNSEICDDLFSFFRTKGVLYHFVTDFVKKVFLDHMCFAVTEKTRVTTRGKHKFI